MCTLLHNVPWIPTRSALCSIGDGIMYSNGHLMMNEAHKQLALKFLRSVEVTLNNRATARLNYVNPSISHRLGGGGGSLTTGNGEGHPREI